MEVVRAPLPGRRIAAFRVQAGAQAALDSDHDGLVLKLDLVQRAADA